MRFFFLKYLKIDNCRSVWSRCYGYYQLSCLIRVTADVAEWLASVLELRRNLWAAFRARSLMHRAIKNISSIIEWITGFSETEDKCEIGILWLNNIVVAECDLFNLQTTPKLYYKCLSRQFWLCKIIVSLPACFTEFIVVYKPDQKMTKKLFGSSMYSSLCAN